MDTANQILKTVGVNYSFSTPQPPHHHYSYTQLTHTHTHTLLLYRGGLVQLTLSWAAVRSLKLSAILLRVSESCCVLQKKIKETVCAEVNDNKDTILTENSCRCSSFTRGMKSNRADNV